MTPGRASFTAVVVYAACCLGFLWEHAHQFAQADVDLNGPRFGAFAAVATVLPVAVGFAIGRYWAPTVVLILPVCLALVNVLEPLQRPDPSEIETSPGLLVVGLVACHVPLALTGASIRRLVRRRGWVGPGL